MNRRELEVEKAKLKAEEQELKRLKAIYQKSSQDIAEKIAFHDAKIDSLKALDEMDDAQKSVLQAQIYQKNYQKSLQKQIDGFLKDLNSKQYKSINDYIENCYKDGFLGCMYDIAGQGIPIITPIDQKKVVKAMSVDSKISKNLYTKLGEDVDILKKRIANNISRGIAAGDSYANIARNISNASNVGFNKAMRIARTEGHRVQQRATADAQFAAKEKGADVVKQWDSTLDGKTRPNHRKLDGQIRELEEPFEVAGMKPMHPSDFGRPEEDINCRCTLLQRARWALDDDELETLKERAKYFELDKTEDFEDFKKKYLKAAQESETRPKTFEERYSDLKDKKTEAESLLSALKAEKKNVEFDAMVNMSPDSWARAGALIDEIKSLESELENVKSEMKKLQGEKAKLVGDYLISNGICEEVKLPDVLSVDALQEIQDSLTDIVINQKMPPIRSVWYDPMTTGGSLASYNGAEQTIYLSNTFRQTAEEYADFKRKSKENYRLYREKKKLDEIAEKNIKDALEELKVAESAYEKFKATQNYQRAVILKNTTRKVVPESFADIILHEYGHHLQFHLSGNEVLYKKNAKFYGQKLLKSKHADWNPNDLSGKVLASEISAYATESPLECFAEAYVAYRKGIKIPDALEELIKTAIKEAGGKI